MDVFAVTFNCYKKPPYTLHEYLETKLPSVRPDVVVFGFEEISTITDGTGPSSVIKGILQEVAGNLRSMMQKRYPEVDVTLACITHYGNVGMIVFHLKNQLEQAGEQNSSQREEQVQEESEDALSEEYVSVSRERSSSSSAGTGEIEIVESRGVPFGLYGTGLKGAVGVRVVLNGISVSFAVAHLNAGEGPSYQERRDDDLLNVFKGIKFDDGGSLLAGGRCILMGDLNYRVRDNQDEFLEALALLRKKGVPLEEAPVTFEPSYKYQVGQHNVLNTKREPSWCDRIVYLCNEATPIKYDSIMECTLSDHKPVYLHLKIAEGEHDYGKIRQSDLYGYDTNHDVNHRLRCIVDSIVWVGTGMATTTLGRIAALTIAIVVAVSCLHSF